MSELAAYHEAGHAFMAYYLGGAVRSVTVEPEWYDGPDREADIEIEWPLDRLTAAQLSRNIALVALAGPAAEMLHRGEPLHPGLVAEWAADWRMAWEATQEIWPNHRDRLTKLEQETRQVYHLLNEDSNWAIVAAIVDSLVAHETLDGEEVAEIVRHWSRFG